MAGWNRSAAIKGNQVPVSFRFASLAAAAVFFAGVPALAQETAISAAAKGPKEVKGATADRVQLVDTCGGHKFESLVEIDPATHRMTRIKLCAKPGASDGDWVKTLKSAIVQIEQRNMPPQARDKVIAELEAEVARFAKPITGGPIYGSTAAPLTLGKGMFADKGKEPEVPFETSKLPPIVPLKAKVGAAGKAGGPVVPPVKPIRASIRCLERGETGKGGTCDFFDKNSVLMITAIGGLEKGGTVRFLRRGEERGDVDLGATATGQARRVPLPSDICRGLSYSKVEVLILALGETRVGARFGPYGLRC